MNHDTEKLIGKYRHYKGKEYQVIGIGKHTESEEKLVIYKALYEPYEIWARPFNMFFEKVNLDDKDLQRFEKLED